MEVPFTAFTTTFEDLHGLKQLPGLAVQRLMGQGYGFGGEEDPARMVFNGRCERRSMHPLLIWGIARIRLLVNEVNAVQPDKADA